MTRIEYVLQEIDQFDDHELRLLLAEISKRLERSERAKTALRKIRGLGSGVWTEDAQVFVNQLRDQD